MKNVDLRRKKSTYEKIRLAETVKYQTSFKYIISSRLSIAVIFLKNCAKVLFLIRDIEENR